MKLIHLGMEEYLKVLASNAPAPGGGSVSALGCAQGVALANMVAELTIGKEKYSDYQEIVLAAKKKGDLLLEDLSADIDRDTDAFNLVADAFKMPKNTEEEKKLRSEAIQKGTVAATEVPFAVMEKGLQALEMVETLVGKSNPNASSDLGVAAQTLDAGVKGAWLNVKINVPGIKDQEKVQAFLQKGQKVLEESENIAKRIYQEIERSL